MVEMAGGFLFAKAESAGLLWRSRLHGMTDSSSTTVLVRSWLLAELIETLLTYTALTKGRSCMRTERSSFGPVDSSD